MARRPRRCALVRPRQLHPASPEDWRTEAHWQWSYSDPVHHIGEDLLGLTMEQCCLDVVRSAEHKYVHFADGSALFFDRVEDPDQLRDRSGDQACAEDRIDLMGCLVSWRQRHDDRTLTGTRTTAMRGLVVRRAPRR